jgi:Protein of unknown function (DUF3311)
MTVDDPLRPQRGADGALAESTRRAERSDHSHWNWLLVIPLLATLYPPLYNRIKPALFDIPFFYWYQLMAILLSVLVTLLVFRKTRS